MSRPGDQPEITAPLWRRIFAIAGWLVAAALGAVAISASMEASEQLHLRALINSAATSTQNHAEQEHARAVSLIAQAAIRRGDAMGGITTILSLAPADHSPSLGQAAIATLRQGLIDNHEAALIPRKGGAANHAHLSADGKHVVSLDAAGHAILWTLDGPTPQGVALLGASGTPCTDAQFSPDGQSLVTAMRDGTVRLWRVADPTASRDAIAEHGGAISALAFSPDGRWLAMATDAGGLQIADLADSAHRKQAFPTQSRAVRQIAFSGDARFMATAGADPDGLVSIWTLTGAEPTAQEFNTGGEVRSIGFAARGAGMADHLMTVSLTGIRREPVVQFWWPDRPLGSEKVVAYGRSHDLDARFSPDGKALLLTEFGDAPVVQTHELDRSWTLGAVDPADSVVLSRFLPDGKSAVTISESGLIRLWTWTGEPQIRDQFSGHAGLIEAAEISADGRSLMTLSVDDTIRIWDLDHVQTGLTRLVATEDGANSESPSALASPDGRWLIVNPPLGESAPVLWDLHAVPPSAQALAGDGLGRFKAGGFSPEGHGFVLVAQDGAAWMGALTDGGTVTTAELPPGPGLGYRAAAFTPDGQRLAAVASNGVVVTWDFWRSPLTPEPHARADATADDQLVNAAFSPDGETLAVTLTSGDSAAPDAHTLIWGLKIDGPPHVVTQWSEPTQRSMAIATDNRTLLIANDAGEVATLAVNSPRLDLARKLDGIVIDRLARPEAPRRIVVSPDRHWAVALSWNRNALLFDLQHPNRSFPLDGHTDIINAAAFDSTGQHLATAGDDGTVRLWELAEDQAPEASVLDLRAGPLNFVGFDAGRHRLIAAGGAGVFLWDIASPEELVGMAKARVTRCLTGAQRMALGLKVSDAALSLHQIRPASACPGG